MERFNDLGGSIVVDSLPKLLIFPPYKNPTNRKLFISALSLTQSFVKLSPENKLTPPLAVKLQNKLSKIIPQIRIFSGGSSSLFAWSFPYKDYRILIKPYYNCSLEKLIFHYFSVVQFGSVRTYSINNRFVTVKISPAIAIGLIKGKNSDFPVIITRESLGQKINDPRLIRLIGKLIRSMTLEGFIVDLYPPNWRLLSSDFGIILEYIDLLSYDMIKNYESKIKEVIEEFE